MEQIMWKPLDSSPLPSLEEVRRQALQERILFPAVEEITPDWIEQSQTYQLLFGILFQARTGVSRLEDRIAARGITPAPEELKGYYQKYDRLGLRYFYLRGVARVERLTQEQRALLLVCGRTREEDTVAQASRLVEETFETVMAVSPENPTVCFEPRQTLHGDYRIRGNSIPLAMRSVARFTPEGNLESEEAELDRIRVFTNIWRQADDAFSADLGCSTTTAIEVFDL